MELDLRHPDDFHLHLRDGSMLRTLVADSAERFARAIVMPNLRKPVTTVRAALAYRRRILAALPAGLEFEPLMTLYLTESTLTAELKRAADNPHVHAVKYYPAGATTNSESGVLDIHRVYPLLDFMQKHELPLLVHGEVTDAEVDVFDREQVFIDRVLAPLIERFPALRVVFEHVTTRQAVQFVQSRTHNLAATITAHHLLLDRNALFRGGLRPHHYCLPVLKRAVHREALVAAATSGDSRFFLGTDSAPHPVHAKENACGCAGIYTAHAALELYAEVFEQAGALNRLEQFASENGAAFYRLPVNTGRVKICRESWQVPATLPLARTKLVPFRAGETCAWKLTDRSYS